MIPRRWNTRTKWTSGLTSICDSCPVKQPKSSWSIRVAIDAIPAPTPWISCSVFSTSAGDRSLQMAPASPPNRSLQTSLAADDNVLAPCSTPHLGRTARSFSNPISCGSSLDTNCLGSRQPFRSISAGIRHAFSHGMPRSKATAIRNAKRFSRMSVCVSPSSSLQSKSKRVWPNSLSRLTTVALACVSSISSDSLP